MKKVFSALLFFCSIFGMQRLQSSTQESDLITPPLIELLNLTDVKNDGTLCSIVEGTQKQWLRPAGKERWQAEDLPADKAKKVIELATQMGLFQEKNPLMKEYDYAVLFGATRVRMRLRLEYLIKLWKQGTRFHSIAVLVSERPLDPEIEKMDNCKTEADAVHVVWASTPMPVEFKALPVVFITAPMIQDANGLRRPGTSDTLAAWLSTNPKPGSCLFISNQPYCSYQNAIVKEYIPHTFTFETVGTGATPGKQNSAVVLDTIARWLYAEAKTQKLCH